MGRDAVLCLTPLLQRAFRISIALRGENALDLGGDQRRQPALYRAHTLIEIERPPHYTLV